MVLAHLQQALDLAVLVMLASGLMAGAQSPGRSARALLGAGGDGGVQAAIAHGYKADRTSFPYIAALLGGKGYWIGCSGSLVRPRLVVTAAHCMFRDGKTVEVNAVLIGLLNWATDSKSQYEYRRVTKILYHGNYPKREDMAYDVAVLLLDKPAKTKPVALAPSNYTLVPVKNGIKGGDWLLVAGWGSTDTGNPAFNLMYTSLPFVDKATCNSIYINQFNADAVSATHICAGWSTDHRDSCTGDSGGPLVKRVEGKGDVLVGIVSYGVDETCGGDLDLGAYTSIMVMRPWLVAKIKELKV